ncbi:MAG: hypothetical protein MRZ69_02100 [Lachnospiraceae bacterium]|nr:hypothetical protein [Lachnospiraceae bacterium]
MNNYTTAFEGMPALLSDYEHVMAEFTRELYPDAFQKYCERHSQTLGAVENGYRQVIDKDQFLTNMAEELASSAEKLLAKQTKKSAKEQCAANLNMCLVVFVLPAVLEMNEQSSEAFSEKILTAWKSHFPKTNLKAATFKQINSGFKRKFCYITTAVCETFGKPDDCYELNQFRSYRDNYLLKREDGERMVLEYYDLAPTIVKHINKRDDYREIYQEIWDTYLAPCLAMIESGENEACMKLYTDMVRKMQKQFFITNRTN